MPLQLRHNLEDLWIDSPVVQVGDGTLKKWCHTGVAGFNVPVMARIVRVWPCDTDQSNEMYNWIFLGMRIQQLAYLRPVGWSVRIRRFEEPANVPGNKVNEHIVR